MYARAGNTRAAPGHCLYICAACHLRAYCTTQRTGKNQKFYRLPGPPRRLDLTQKVLMTTESASSESGGRQAGAGGSAKTRACIRGIPRSARGRGRVARPERLTRSNWQPRARDLRQNYKDLRYFFRKQSTRKSDTVVLLRIPIRIELPSRNFDSGHPARTRIPIWLNLPLHFVVQY